MEEFAWPNQVLQSSPMQPSKVSQVPHSYIILIELNYDIFDHDVICLNLLLLQAFFRINNVVSIVGIIMEFRGYHIINLKQTSCII